MSLFSKRTCILWPHKFSTDIFLDRSENNSFSFDFNLWQPLSSPDLAPLLLFIKENHLSSVSVLVPDDVIVTKSFVYDAKINSIDKEEIIKLVAGSVGSNLTPESINFNLIPQTDKTIIRSEFINLEKFNVLKQNLTSLGIQINSFTTTSGAIAKVIATFYQQEYFLLHSPNPNDSFLMLSSGSSVYLTSYLRKNSLNIQKLVNYSKLYFNHTVNKIYLPATNTPDIDSTPKLDKTFYDPVQIANSLHQPSNLPLPVLGLLLAPPPPETAIIKPMSEVSTTPLPSVPAPERSKNLLPIIAVFVVTAAVASIIIWFVLNRNSSDSLENPTGQSQPTPIISETPTEAPTPTPPPVDKKLKLQVLNATDINGQAATLKAILIDLGFSSVTVGNSKETVTGNEVRLKTSLSTAQEYFQGQLVNSFPAKYSATLKETSTYDIVFIIGSDLSKPSSTQ